MELASLISGVLVCFLINSSSFQVYSTLFKFENITWTEAFLACKNCGSRLPRISTRAEGLPYKLLDKSLQDSSCFWLGASYDHTDSSTGYQYPSECCEIIWKLGNQTNVQCVECVGKGCYEYVCEKDTNTVTQVANQPQYLTQIGASSVCSQQHLNLPSKYNVGLLDMLHENGTPRLWTRSVRRLNMNPNPSDDQIPICFCNGSIQFTNCPQQLTTFCISETSTEGSKATADYTASSLDTSKTIKFSAITLNGSTSSANVPTRKAEREQETIASLVQNTEITTTDSSFPQPTLLLSSSEDGDKQNFIGNGTIIGSIVGPVSVVLIIIGIVVVIRLRRSKGAEDTNSKCQVNANNLLEGKTPVNARYADVDGEYSDTKTSNPIQNYEQESVTYKVPNKNDDSCRNRNDDVFVIPTNKEQPSTVLYSVVQKRQKTEAGNEEYDKISFGKANQIEQSGNVYNKVIFHRESREGHTGGLYDKANFHPKPRDEYGGNLYDKADFNRSPSEELSGNVYDKANIEN